MVAQDDVPLIADMDIEALLEQELNTLNVDDFYLLDHLIDINSKVKEQQGRMDAVRDEATRIFESFGEIETQILLDRQQSDTVLDKAFEQVVRTYVAPKESNNEEAGLIVNPPKDVLLGAATRGDLADVELITPASIPRTLDSWSTDQQDFGGPSILVLLLEEMERNQANQASLRETLRDELLALGAQLENIEESEVELETAIRELRAELVWQLTHGRSNGMPKTSPRKPSFFHPLLRSHLGGVDAGIQFFGKCVCITELILMVNVEAQSGLHIRE